jgi:ABC-2 type transport system permease protein
MAAHAGERLARAPLLIVLIVVFFVLYPKAFWLPGWREAVLFIVATQASFLLRFVMQYCEATLAFWTERAGAISHLSFLVQLALSGSIAPLELYPPIVRQIAMLTPFPYLIYFPARQLVGPADAMGPVWRGFVVMAVWFVAMLLLNRVLWRVGVKRYSGMGA